MVRLAQKTNANSFGTMSEITIMFVAPLSSDHRGPRRHRSLFLSYYYWKKTLVSMVYTYIFQSCEGYIYFISQWTCWSDTQFCKTMLRSQTVFTMGRRLFMNKWANDGHLTISARWPTLDVRICRLETWRQILTSKVDHRTERIETFIMVVDSYDRYTNEAERGD